MWGLIRLLLFLTLMVGVLGCSAELDSSRRGHASNDELGWVRDYAAWTKDFNRVSVRVGVVREAILAGWKPRTDLPSAFGRLSECSAWLAERVGRAPTARLQPVQELAEQACAALELAIATELEGSEGDPGAVFPEANAHWAKGDELLYRASERLSRLVGDARALPVLARAAGSSHIDPRYGRAASEITHDVAEVRCWSSEDWRHVSTVFAALDASDYVDLLGMASPDERRISLAPDVCTGLAVLAYARVPPQQSERVVKVANAVLTLAHEAVHLRAQGATEAETECYALQEIRRAARALGATPAYANRLARVAWTEIYPLNEAMYSTPACRSGGPLDVDRARRAWP